MFCQVYDSSLKRIAYLENAYNIGYELPLNALWTASFALPADDPKNAYCTPLIYIEIYDGDERIELFRIIGEDFTRSTTAETYYSCEHILATLMNDVLFQYHQVGGTGVHTDDVINYILGFQSVERWTLQSCTFTHEFEYNFENENLLSALYAVPEPFDVEYRWWFSTTTYPWKLYLQTFPTSLYFDIRYAKNMLEIKKTKDSTGLANRIYALGYGEGVNQLTIKSETVGGVAYVEDATSQSSYGICSTVLVDARYQVAANLKAYAEAILAVTKDPYITYEVSAIDLYRLTGDAASQFWSGYLVRIEDTEDNLSVQARIVNVAKTDVTGDPGAVTVTIANKSKDISSSIADLQNRARITNTYAQGATNLAFVPFSDNADATHPASFKFYIPTETVRINKVQLTVEFEAFRAYSQGAASGGSSSETSGSYDYSSITSSSQSLSIDTGTALNWESGSNGHNHGITDGTWLAIADASLNITGRVTHSTSGQHYHSFTQPGHSHSVSIGSHSHSVSIPSHTHDITYGIYTGTTGSSATIKVDGNTVTGVSSYDDIDIVSYLDTDADGKISRGTWHEVTITPNQMSRVVGSLFVQLFTNSRGGGDY